MRKLNVFGSARMDAFLELPQEMAQEVCKLNTKTCVIELSYASKLPLNNVTFCVGGNGANVAVGSKRLGTDSLLVAELGQGPIADMAKNELAKEIDIPYVTQTEGLNQGFGAVIVYQDERTILSYYSPGRPPFPQDLEPSVWAYLTSVGEKFEEMFDEVLTWIERNNTKLAFNPGGRQIKKGKEWLGKYLKKTEILLVNREEGEEIVGMTSTFGKEKLLLDELMSLGPKICVVTDGSNGSFAKEADKYYKTGILPVDAKERTGAGDSYSTGFLTARINGKTVPEAMIMGTVNAASVIGFTGPQKGLLKATEMPDWLEKAKSSNLEVVEM